MKSFDLYLARHGQTFWNLEKRLQGRKNSPLTDLGQLQAQALGRRLRNVPLDALWSSSAPRALQTAHLVTAQRELPLPVQGLDQLQEIHLGDWEGLTKDMVWDRWGEEARSFWYQPERWPAWGAESWLQVQERVLEAVALIGQTASSALAVSHGMTIQVFLWSLSGEGTQALYQHPVVHQASLTHVRVYPDRDRREWEVVMRDNRDHLQGLLSSQQVV
ncbi:MAG: histidine phosphatase family protein [Spirochaetales bacterium]|nr:histidine phosphatase family protein [Spirochaetales bacterium]